MKIKPVKDRLVRDPATGRELKEVITVPDSDGFWLRRLADGDVQLEQEKEKTVEVKS